MKSLVYFRVPSLLCLLNQVSTRLVLILSSLPLRSMVKKILRKFLITEYATAAQAEMS